MRAYLNAAYHCWAANKMFNSRSSKTAILAILKSFEKPLKKKANPFQHVFDVLLVLLTGYLAWQDGNLGHPDVISTPA